MRKIIQRLFLLLLFLSHPSFVQASVVLPQPDEPMEELSDIEWLIKHPKPGVIFTLREYDDEGFSWTAERLNYYIDLLRNADPKLRIAILAHGDEVASLSHKSASHYEKLHHFIQDWAKQDITTHACGSMAHMLGLNEDDFPDYIDVVPYGPSQVKDYMELGYSHIELELTW